MYPCFAMGSLPCDLLENVPIITRSLSPVQITILQLSGTNFESSDPDPKDYLEHEHSTWGDG